MTRTSLSLSLAYSILAGPIVWAIHFVIVYMITEFGCRVNFNNWLFITPSNIYLVIVIVTVVSLLGVGFGGLLAYRQWKTQEQYNGADSSIRTHDFLVTVGMLLSALFLFAIVMTAVPTLFLSTCGQAI
jgi:uncharacterized membrane protein